MSHSPVPFRPPQHEEIALCAFMIWVSEGYPHGRDVAHWLQAEAQLTATRLRDAVLMSPESAGDARPLGAE